MVGTAANVEGASSQSEEAFALDLNRTSGTALTSECPRAGLITLTDYQGRQLVMPTACKTWRCLSCRDRLRSLFKMRVVSGCFALAQCWLITFTYKVDADRRVNVTFAKEDWKEFWRRWKKLRLPHLEWLRVSERTKKGMIHHHVVAGSPTAMKARCYGREFDDRGFLRRFVSCGCLSHVASRVWKEVTGDSYIVHVQAVTSPKGMGNYLAKYMMKEFGVARAAPMESRRWSSSRGWPGRGRLRLRNTVRKLWAVTNFQGGRAEEWELGGPEELRVRSGPQWAIDFMAKASRVATMNRLRRVVDEHRVNC